MSLRLSYADGPSGSQKLYGSDLPLSSVASVFGKNTSDVREMALTQWMFWTSAIVFTIAVVLITVYSVEVPSQWRWLE